MNVKQIQDDLEKAVANFVATHENYMKNQKSTTSQKVVNIREKKFPQSKNQRDMHGVINNDFIPMSQKKTQHLVVHYIDIYNSDKTDGWAPSDGVEVHSSKQSLSGLSGDSYENELIIPKGYELVVADAGAESGNFDYDSNKTQNEFVYIKGMTQKVNYNVIDDTTGDYLEKNLLFDEGGTGQDLNKTQKELEDIAKKFLDKYNIVSIEQLPAKFDNDVTTDQVVNIHLETQPTLPEMMSEQGNPERAITSGLIIGGTVAMAVAGLTAWVTLKKRG